MTVPPTVAKVDRPKSASLYPGPGLRIRRQKEFVDAQVITGLSAFDTPAISDLMNRLYTMEPKIHNVTADDLRLAGPACTVKLFPGDNLMVHKALDIARPGDVIVIDAHRSEMTAVLGDLISTKARHRGIAGFVVDGLVRDVDAIRAMGDFPVFARGVTPIGPLHRGPGEINYPVSAGGIVVSPGDVVVGDLNGVVVIPAEIAESLLQRLQDQSAAEANYTAQVAQGSFSNAWVDAVLAESGVTIDDED